jgi:hypothetical protein
MLFNMAGKSAKAFEIVTALKSAVLKVATMNISVI